MKFFEKLKNDKKIRLITILSLVGVLIVAAAIITGCSIHQKNEEERAQKEAEAAFLHAIEEAQTNTINDLKNKVNGIVAPLQVPDQNGENPSLENCTDIDAMNNAVNELGNVTNDVNGNALLTQAQKDELNQFVAAQVAAISDRAQRVQAFKDAMEAAAAEKAAAEKAAKKKATSTSTSTKKSEPAPAAEPAAPAARTFVYIDIGSQRLYVLNGPVGTDVDACEVLFSTGIVSGSAGSADTPTGRYSIKSKQSGVTLRPSDGSLAYVDYWMPFIGNSIGIHDATWRGEEEFGTDQYTISGSHGCVNLSHGAAATVWDLVSVGTPVIVT